MILLTEMQIYRNCKGRIQLLGKLNLITLNEHFGVLPTGTSYSMNYVLKCVQLSGFIQKPELQTPINSTVNGYK